MLGLYDLNLVEVAATLFKDTPRRTSPVVDLTMVLHAKNSNLAGDDLWTLLDLPETLHKLRMSVIGTYGTDLVPILKERLWPALDRFKNQLSHLDVHGQSHGTWRRMIDDDDEQDVPPRQAIKTIPYCCPLRTFTALRSLAVIPDLLLGDQCEHRKLKSHHLQGHLPDKLARLTLYETHNATMLSEDWDAYLAAYVHQNGGPLDRVLIDGNFWDNMSADVESYTYEKFAKTGDACFDQETEFVISREDADGFEDGGRLMEVYTETEMVRQHFQYLSMPPSERHTPGVQHLNTFLHMLMASGQEREQDYDDLSE